MNASERQVYERLQVEYPDCLVLNDLKNFYSQV